MLFRMPLSRGLSLPLTQDPCDSFRAMGMAPATRNLIAEEAACFSLFDDDGVSTYSAGQTDLSLDRNFATAVPDVDLLAASRGALVEAASQTQCSSANTVITISLSEVLENVVAVMYAQEARSVHEADEMIQLSMPDGSRASSATFSPCVFSLELQNQSLCGPDVIDVAPLTGESLQCELLSLVCKQHVVGLQAAWREIEFETKEAVKTLDLVQVRNDDLAFVASLSCKIELFLAA